MLFTHLSNCGPTHLRVLKDHLSPLGLSQFQGPDFFLTNNLISRLPSSDQLLSLRWHIQLEAQCQPLPCRPPTPPIHSVSSLDTVLLYHQHHLANTFTSIKIVKNLSAIFCACKQAAECQRKTLQWLPDFNSGPQPQKAYSTLQIKWHFPINSDFPHIFLSSDSQISCFSSYLNVPLLCFISDPYTYWIERCTMG